MVRFYSKNDNKDSTLGGTGFCIHLLERETKSECVKVWYVIESVQEPMYIIVYFSLFNVCMKTRQMMGV